MPVTTEALLTHPRCFGLTTASPVQRAICRAADGIPMGDLALDPTVQDVFGGEDAILALPLEPPKELLIVAAIRSGKSLFAAALALKIALTIDLSFMGSNEVARVSVLSLDLDKAKIVMQHLMGALEREGGLLTRYLVKKPKPTADRVCVRRDDGRVVEIVVAAGKRGGGSLVSRWTVAAIFDEAARQQGQADGIVNYDDMRAGVIARLSLVKGAQLIAVTSPWAARGPIYEAVQTYKGPSRFLVLVRATGPQINPVLWTPAAVKEIFETDEAAYVTDVLGEFADVESGWLMADDINRAVGDRTETTLPRVGGSYYTAAMDPGLRGNSWTLAIVGYRPSETGDSVGDRFFVARCRQWTGSRKAPLSVLGTLKEVRDELRAYGLTEVWTDGWGAEFIRQSGESIGITVNEDDANTAEKDERPVDFRAKVVAGQVEMTPDPEVRADMLAARVRRTATAQKLELPITRDGRHCDYVPAIVLAVDKASSGPRWADRIDQWKSSGHHLSEVY